VKLRYWILLRTRNKRRQKTLHSLHNNRLQTRATRATNQQL